MFFWGKKGTVRMFGTVLRICYDLFSVQRYQPFEGANPMKILSKPSKIGQDSHGVPLPYHGIKKKNGKSSLAHVGNPLCHTHHLRGRFIAEQIADVLG